MDRHSWLQTSKDESICRHCGSIRMTHHTKQNTNSGFKNRTTYVYVNNAQGISYSTRRPACIVPDDQIGFTFQCEGEDENGEE